MSKWLRADWGGKKYQICRNNQGHKTMRSKNRNDRERNWLSSWWCFSFLDLVSRSFQQTLFDLLKLVVMFLFQQQKDCWRSGQEGEDGCKITTGHGRNDRSDWQTVPARQWLVRSHVLVLSSRSCTTFMGSGDSLCPARVREALCLSHLLITGNLTAEANESHSWGLGCFCQLQQWGEPSGLLCSGARKKGHRRELVPQVRNNYGKFYPGATFKNTVSTVGRKQETVWKKSAPLWE